MRHPLRRDELSEDRSRAEFELNSERADHGDFRQFRIDLGEIARLESARSLESIVNDHRRFMPASLLKIIENAREYARSVHDSSIN